MKKLKGNYWLFMLVAIVVLGVGYAALANISLNLTGTATSKGTAVDGDLKVRFVKFDAIDNDYVNNAEQNAAVVSGAVGIEASNVSLAITNDTTATFAISEGFDTVGDSVTLVYNVVNESEGIPAYVYLDVENQTNTASEYFRITKTVDDSELNEGEVTTVTVKVELIKRPKLDASATFNVNLIASAEKSSTIAGSSSSAPIVYASASTTSELTSLLSDNDITNLNVALEENVDYAGSIVTVPSGKNVTIDLNGNTFSSNYIDVANGSSLVIEDETGTGTMALEKSIAVRNDAELVYNSGTLDVSDDYGFYISGGSAVVNGGTITSKSSVFSSNNTAGDFDVTINGGTFTSELGPVVYMPTPGTLTINDGIINGGIIFKIGTVTINGGTINAAAAHPGAVSSWLDSYEEYYNYSGNAWLGDAIVVWGGFYTAGSNSNATNNNITLNINGGTIKSENGHSTALTVLNLGKVAQNININISGGTFSTTTSGRNTFEIKNALDINTTADFKANNNKVNVSIVGGNGLTGVTSTGNYWNTNTLYTNQTY